MFKTKEFVSLKAINRHSNKDRDITLDEVINNFIKDNNITELFDIKYSKSMEFNQTYGLHLLTSALIIYK